MCTRLLPCPVCSHPRFNNIDTMRISLISAATKHLNCPICNELCLGLDKLTIHLFSHCFLTNNNEEPSNCNLTCCEYQKLPEYTQNDLQIEAKFSKFNLKPSSLETVVSEIQNKSTNIVQTPKDTETLSSKCDLCEFNFESEKLLLMHKKIVHDVSEVQDLSNTFACHLCSKVFKMRGSLRLHLRVKHFGTKFKNNYKQNIIDIKSMSPKQDSKVHFPQHFNFSDCSNKCSPEATHGKNVEQKQWECDVCSKTFTTKYFLKKHKRLHTGEMPYSCTRCGKTFTFQQSYHKHLLYHSDDKPHTCGTCGRSFKELSTLHNHQRIHTGEKPFACETCGKCFRQRVSYLVHRRIHTGAMPYKCTACNKNFRYKVSQRSHKCAAQPPGTVVRQSGELLQKLLQGTNIHVQNPTQTSNDEYSPHAQSVGGPIDSKYFIETKAADESSETIDNIVEESYNNMCRGNQDFYSIVVPPDLPQLNPTELPENTEIDQNIREKKSNFQNVSPPLCHSRTTCKQLVQQHLETINEESLRNLLYEHVLDS